MTDEDLAMAYGRVFGGGEGASVLGDMERVSKLRDPVFPPGSMDGLSLALRAAQVDGQRLLMGYVLNQIYEGQRLSRRESETENPEPQPIEKDIIKP